MKLIGIVILTIIVMPVIELEMNNILLIFSDVLIGDPALTTTIISLLKSAKQTDRISVRGRQIKPCHRCARIDDMA